MNIPLCSYSDFDEQYDLTPASTLDKCIGIGCLIALAALIVWPIVRHLHVVIGWR